MRKYQVLFMAVLFLCGLQPSVALAANLPYSLSVTPFAGGYVFEGNQHLTNKPIYGLAAGYNFGEHWAIEAVYRGAPDSHTTSGVQTAWSAHSVSTDILYHFFPEQRFVPYAAAGGGLMLLVPRHGHTYKDGIVDYGVGFKYFLTDYVALRADVRHIFDITMGDAVRRSFYNNLAYTGGVTFQLGGVKPAARVVEEQKPVKEVESPRPAPEVVKPVPAPEPEPAVAPTEAPVPAPVQEAPLTLTAEKGELAAAPAAAILLTGITIDKDSLEIVTTKHIGAYKTFTLSQPSRLVIDVDGAANGLGVKRIPVHRFGISAVRFGNHTDFLRIVLEASQGRLLPYRIEETGKGLKVIMTSP